MTGEGRRRKKLTGKERYESAFAATPVSRYRERTLALLHEVYSAIRPLGSLDAERRLNFVASSLLMNLGGRHLLVTAAHVLDTEKELGPLHVATPVGPVPLEGARRWTAAPGGDRANDPVDLGFVVLADRTAAALEGARFLTLDDLDAAVDPPDPSEQCIAIGFPGNWVDDSDPAKHVAQPLFAIGPRMDAADVGAVGITNHTHVVMGYDKKSSVDLDGPRVPPNPHGMSGGGVWRFASLNGDPAAPNKLVGVLVEWRGVAMVATRVGLLLGGLEVLLPGLRGELASGAGSSAAHVLE